MNATKIIVLSIGLLFLTSNAHASDYTKEENTASFDVFKDNGWTTIKDIDPASGGQAFDTEYLFMRYNDDDTLSIGLQTGFDLSDGKYERGNSTYFGGDLALSFKDENGDLIGNQATKDDHHGKTDYNYAVDFGLLRTNDEGLYEVDDWNTKTSNIKLKNDGVYTMESFTRAGDLTQNLLGSGNKNGNKKVLNSYYRIVTFDLNDIDNLSTSFTVDAFWTMSCGNDQINGSYSVSRNSSNPNPIPEPSIIALLGIGSLSIFAAGIRRKKAIK